MRILDRKEKHRYHDHDDLDYYGIRDIESLLDKVDEEDYYRPILAKKIQINVSQKIQTNISRKFF